MATTYTPRLGLPKQAGGDLVDVSLIRAAMDKIDSDSDANVVTSGTRPGSPYIGQIIFETDTTRLLFWNGTTWWPVGTQTMGKTTYATPNALAIPTAATDIATLSVVLLPGPAVVHCVGTLMNGSSAAVRTGTYQVMANSVAVPGTFAGLSQQKTFIVNASPTNETVNFYETYDITAVAGSISIALRTSTNVAASVVICGVRIWVEQGGL